MEEALCDPSSSLVQCYSVYPFVTVWGGGVGWGGREGRGEKKKENGRKMCECGDECGEDTMNWQSVRRQPGDL